MERTIDDEFIGDVLVCAFDGGLGACWYWAEPDTDGPWLTTTSVNSAGGPVWASCRIVRPTATDLEGDEKSIRETVNAEVIRLGIQRILDDKELIAPYIRDYIVAAVSELDAGHVDAEAADCIVQVGLFGTLVFG
jgi:hypothetical protein